MKRLTVQLKGKKETIYLCPDNHPATFLDEGFLQIQTIGDVVYYINCSQIKVVRVEEVKVK